MSIGSVMQSLFGGASSTPAPQQQTNQNVPTGNPNPGQPLPGTMANQTMAPNGMVPSANPTQQPAPGSVVEQKEVSPLDGFTDIWQTSTNPDPNAIEPIFQKLDPNKVMESARKVDFSRAITPEQLQSIAGGGEGAVKAFAAAMNSVAQTVYAQNAMATSKIVEQALEKQQTANDARMPSLVKKFSANESLMAENPLLSNPAIQPLVGALQEQLIRKNPNATAAAIQQQVNDYFAALGTTFGPKPKETPQQKADKNAFDWDKFLQ
jgi:hypothetical protein